MVEESERTRLGSEHDEEGEDEIEERRKKWLKHYSSHHRILLVGEGDFSFSSSLASAFGSASNVTATSLDHYDVLIGKYRKAKSNLGKLKKLGASLLHEVDATKMKYRADLSVRKFDRIIFNFPHAGFHGKEDHMQLINMHRTLMNGFFRNASQMLRADGEVHVSHKTNAPYCLWKLEELASWNSLKLIEQTAFKIKNYPGYHNKRGDGSRCDEPFPLEPCSTFKFRFYPGAREVFRETAHNNAIQGEYWQIYASPIQMPVEFPPIYGRSVQAHVGSERMCENLVRTQEQSLPLSFDPFASMTHVPSSRITRIELGMNSRNEYGGISAYHQNIVQEKPQRTCYDDAGFHLVPLPGLASEQHYADVERRTSVGDLNLLQRLQHEENLRRLRHSFGRPWLDRTSLLNAGYAACIELGMNSRNESGGISAYHRNIVQDIPQRTCYDDAGFHLVPLPGLASEQHYADVERRTSVGDLNLLQWLQHEENLGRLRHSFGRPWLDRTSLLNAGYAACIELGMNSRNEYGGISAYDRNIVQEIPQRTCYDDAGFGLVPLPGLASEQYYANVERRSVGDLNLLQQLQHEENLRRHIHSFGRPWLDCTSLLNAGYAEESQRW